MEVSQFDEARGYLERLVTNGKRLDDAHYYLGYINAEEDHNDAAIEHRASDVRLPDLFEAAPDDLEVVIDVEASAMPLLADFIPDGARMLDVLSKERVQRAGVVRRSVDTSLKDGRKPDWLKVKASYGDNFTDLTALMDGQPGRNAPMTPGNSHQL